MTTPVDVQRQPSCWPRWLAPARWSLLALAFACLASCGGGGVGVGGTGSFAMGPVSGFGSIFVNGIEFDDARARVLDDDGAALPGGRDALRLGMVTEVQAGEIVTGASGPSAVASVIQLARLAQGPVASIDTAAQTLSVLGQTLLVDASTVFDAAIAGGLTGLRAGDTVSVHALPDAAGRPIATRVERAPAAEPWRLRGYAASVDAVARRLVIGAAVIDYGAATNPPAGLAAGTYLHLRLAPATAGGVLRVDGFSPPSSAPGDVAKVTLEGIVTSQVAGSSFRLGSLTVDVRNAAITPTSAALMAGVAVQVAGRLEGGIVIAESVIVTTTTVSERRNYQLAGGVSALDAARRTFVVRGVTVDYAAARLVNGSAASLAVAGVTVRVHGTLSDDGSVLQARTVTFP